MSRQLENTCRSTGSVQWFPRHISDLDLAPNKILLTNDDESEINSDHPGFSDPLYQARRKYFTNIANNYRHGQPLPRVEYTKEEVETWKIVFNKLSKLYPTQACKKFNDGFQVMIEKCGYCEDKLPQLEDVSNFLKDCTGFTLRPVAGYLRSREFLNGFAFRVLHTSQFMRHSSDPHYSPEPDVCHELLGHAPLLLDPEFAQFLQEIGLASLGASDDYIEKLTACFWFTVEFGLCREVDELKAYGAGLLSSYGELQYSLTDKPERNEFDPEKTSLQKFPITEFQPVYYVESLENIIKKMKEYIKTTSNSSGLRFNACTQSIEVLDSTHL